ncbi:MAG TPA: hypothetical protein VL484_08290 [Vicinamibacterales bacterium]|jgi:hypothetical protein|nr:hypothetical protein [Vicinamibacterales bacterium]
MRRLMIVMGIAAMSFANRADALTVQDVIELSKAGVSDQVLLALIDVDRRVYTLDADSVKTMKAAGVSDTVLLAMIHAGRDDSTPPSDVQSPMPEDAQFDQEPPPVDYGNVTEIREVPVPVPVPVAVPVAVPVVSGDRHHNRISTIVTTDTGAAVRVNVPVPANCLKAEPVYWGNGGKRRPGTWEPPPQIVCR